MENWYNAKENWYKIHRKCEASVERLQKAIKKETATPGTELNTGKGIVDAFVLLGRYRELQKKAYASLQVQKNGLCKGCRDDFYNGKNPYGIKKCWFFDKARIVEDDKGTLKMVCWNPDPYLKDGRQRPCPQAKEPEETDAPK